MFRTFPCAGRVVGCTEWIGTQRQRSSVVSPAKTTLLFLDFLSSAPVPYRNATTPAGSGQRSIDDVIASGGGTATVDAKDAASSLEGPVSTSDKHTSMYLWWGVCISRFTLCNRKKSPSRVTSKQKAVPCFYTQLVQKSSPHPLHLCAAKRTSRRLLQQRQARQKNNESNIRIETTGSTNRPNVIKKCKTTKTIK